MDVKYAYYSTSKGYRVVGGTAAHFLKADGSLDNNNYLTTDTVQNVNAIKSFITAGGNAIANHSLRVFSTDGSKAGMSFYTSGIGAGNIAYNGSFEFKTSDDLGYKQLISDGFKKDGSDDNSFLTAGGGSVLRSNYPTTTLADTKYIPYFGALNNVNLNDKKLSNVNSIDAGVFRNVNASVLVKSFALHNATQVTSFGIKLTNAGTSNMMGSFTVTVFTYTGISFSFRVNMYKYQNGWAGVPPSITWLHGNSLIIDNLEFYKEDDANMHIKVNIASGNSMAYTKVVITDVLATGGDPLLNPDTYTISTNVDNSAHTLQVTRANSTFVRDNYLNLNNITTNTNQTGLGGNKTTAGDWTFNGGTPTHISLLRPSNGSNVTMAYGFDTPSYYVGLGNSNTFAFGTSPDLNLASNRHFWLEFNKSTANLKPQGGSSIVSRDVGGYSITTTQDASQAEMILRHNWSAKNQTFGIGGIGHTTSGLMAQWGMYKWLNNRTANGNDGFFGWNGDSDVLKASSFEGVGTRMVTADSSGRLFATQDISTGFVPYDNATKDLTLADKNLNFTTGAISKTQGASKIFNKVYQNFTATAQTGILSFKIPSAAVSPTMFDVTIKIYGYQIRYLGEFRISFYRNAGVISNSGHKAIIETTDNFPTNVINVGVDVLGNICINLGEPTTVWSTFVELEVERLVVAYNGHQADWSKGWSHAMETDVSTYTSIFNIVPEILATRTNVASTMANYLPLTGGNLSGQLNLPYQTAKISLGLMQSSGDVHVGASGIAAPTNGTQDYGFYLGYNAYRDTDGNWKHSRITGSINSYVFKGGHQQGGFVWQYSPNIGTDNITFTDLMYLRADGVLIANEFRRKNGLPTQFQKADGSIDSNSYALSSHSHTFASLTFKPTTASGYGITDVPLQAVLGGGINSIRSLDTRSTNPLPSTDLKNGVWFDFKSSSVIGLTGAGTYAGSITMVPYNDNSGNFNTAFRLVQSADDMYFQNYTSAATWGVFRKIWTDKHFSQTNINNWNTAFSQLPSYVTQSSLNTQLANYATLNGVQTFTNTITFGQSPVIPDATLINHAVSYGQMVDYTDINTGDILGYVSSNYASVSHTHSFASLTSKPTTISGYGITDAYTSWNLKTNGVQRTTIASGGTLDLVAGTNVTVGYGAGGVVTINATDTNTTYTAGNGLTLTGTSFSLPVTVVGSGDYISDVTQNANGITVTKGTLPTYVLPTATTNIYGGVRLITDVQNNISTNAVTNVGSRSYAVQLNNTGAMLVNIPWTDTVYTHPTTAGNRHIPAGGNVGQLLKNNGDGIAVWANGDYQPTGNYVTTDTVQTIASAKTFTTSPIVPNATLPVHPVNLGQLTTINNNFQTLNTDQNVTASKSITNGFPFKFKWANVKTWTIHKPNGNALIFAPSETVNAEDWDWYNQISFYDDSTVEALKFRVRGGLPNQAMMADGSLNSNLLTTNTTQSITDYKIFEAGAELLLKGDDENLVQSFKSSNNFAGNIVAGWFYRHYDSIWKVGVIRDSASSSEGFGFDLSTDGGTSFERKLNIKANGKLSAKGFINTDYNSAEYIHTTDGGAIHKSDLSGGGTFIDEIINDQSDYAIRLDPHEYEIDSSGSLEVDDRNRLIHIIGEQIKMVVNFREIYPKQQIVIYNFDQGGTMAVKVYGKTIYNIKPGCFIRLYVTKSRRVIVERDQPNAFIW